LPERERWRAGLFAAEDQLCFSRCHLFHAGIATVIRMAMMLRPMSSTTIA
jgi:hypothetical protein